MNTKHPATFIEHSIANRLRSFIADAEKKGSLHDEQLSIIYKNNWFNLFVAKKYNGLDLPLIEALKIEEGLAWIDGSLGWTTTLCSGANWFAGFIESKMATRIFSNQKVCLAGSGKPSGIAKKINDHYEITGSWHYATGASHATVFTANCIIEENGIALKNEEGNPLVHAFLLLPEEITIRENWPYIGMKATSSYTFEAKNVIVPADRKFIIDKKYLQINLPIYQYPFLHFAEATLAVNFSGMAIHFLDCYEKIIAEKVYRADRKKEMNETIILHLEEIKKLFFETRDSFYNAIETSWDECVINNSISEESLQTISITSRGLAANARKLVSEFYPYCGLNAANPDTDINLVWRDFHTASQHPLLLYK